MASNQTTRLLADLRNSGIQAQFPQLFDVINGLILSVDSVSDDLITVQSILNPGGLGTLPSDVTNFMVSLNPTEIVFSYTSQVPGTLYELRLGSNWDTASYVTTTLANSIPINPLVYGSYTYLIKALNSAGNYSANAASVTFTINAIGGIVATTQVLNNSVLFFWTPPTSTFQISYYNIYKNSVLIGKVSSTFFSYFEIAAGTYSYQIQAVDIAGNLGTPTVSAVLTLPSPTDYILHGSVTDTLFTGTKVSSRTDRNGYLIAPINITETFKQHFDNNSWTTPAAQVAAAYPIFIQPDTNTATYTKVFDFGAIVNNVIVNVFYSTLVVSGTVNLAFTIAVSTDNVTYDTPQNGTSRFGASVRYAKVVITFTPTTDKGLIYISSLQCDLNVHLENDGGTISAVSTDAGGTTVTFNKSYLTVVSITTITKQTIPRDVVVDFDYTSVNPTTFKVLVFDNAGVRQSETVGWASRGILV